jgi:quercetin dioxygenase-like cupin family protein
MKLNNFIKGWLVGDFSPTLILSKDIEIGIKRYKKGDKDQKHYHKETTEYTVVISGVVKMLDKIWSADDIIIIYPNVENEFECIEDACLLVIKTPSLPSDKVMR